MVKYLDIVREAHSRDLARVEAESVSRSANLRNPESASARRLIESGWKPKVSFGEKMVWERPENAFYYSEEAAVCLLGLTQPADEPKALNKDLENNPMKCATLPNDFGKKGDG